MVTCTEFDIDQLARSLPPVAPACCSWTLTFEDESIVNGVLDWSAFEQELLLPARGRAKSK